MTTLNWEITTEPDDRHRLNGVVEFPFRAEGFSHDYSPRKRPPRPIGLRRVARVEHEHHRVVTQRSDRMVRRVRNARLLPSRTGTWGRKRVRGL